MAGAEGHGALLDFLAYATGDANCEGQCALGDG
jgi:hypothetical protein